ncbi:MAG: hypothetical protein FWH11_06610 [Micrococcales bacterium]|nr:hypothetical protein [Micrococcales bacterium]
MTEYRHTYTGSSPWPLIRKEGTTAWRPMSREELAQATEDGVCDPLPDDYRPEYAVRDNGTDDWQPLDDYEAWQAGVWLPPGTNTFGVRDDLATPDQLAARSQGNYDPRPASGEHVAKRVIIVCARCGKRLTEIHDFEHRHLAHDLQSGAWGRGIRAKCSDCYGPLDLPRTDHEDLWRSLERARATKKVVTVKVGDL